MGRNAFYALAAVPPASFIWLLLPARCRLLRATAPLSAGRSIPWIRAELEFAFRMDALAWVMSLLVLGVGALVLVYCARYFKNKDRTWAASAPSSWPSPGPCSAW